MDAGIVKLRCHEVWTRDDGITVLSILPDAAVMLEDAEEVCQEVVKINQGEPRPLLVDMRQIGSITSEAKARYTKEQASISAMALLVNHPIEKMLGNYWVVHQLETLTKLFISEKEAVEWLRKYL
ncbi:MAG: hypothetical protein HQM14_16045 [SAR324 cluster bacterium]|nr:hypothetical protein [SAR324 cluster bacterium]